MTTLAQLHDCHSCNDERSIVQKKTVSQLMKPDQLLPQNAHEQIEALAKEFLGTYAPWLTGIVLRTALAVLWLATHRHEVESMVAQGLVEAAGLRGKTKLGAYSVQQRQSLQGHL